MIIGATKPRWCLLGSDKTIIFSALLVRAFVPATTDATRTIWQFELLVGLITLIVRTVPIFSRDKQAIAKDFLCHDGRGDPNVARTVVEEIQTVLDR